jgi:protein-S-isoprenylcysteine O-methyltransferase Ste14
MLFLSVLTIRGYYGWKKPRTSKSSWSVDDEAIEREGRWNNLLRLILFISMLFLVLIHAFRPMWLSLFIASFASWFRWIGIGLGVVSLPMLAWVHHTLGKQWSTNIQLLDEHTLITVGPYKWIRHPMYTALFIFFFGLAIASSNWLFVLLALVAFFVLYARIGIEEKMMQERFGDDYIAYM